MFTIYCYAVSNTGVKKYEGHYLSPLKRVRNPFFCVKLGYFPPKYGANYVSLERAEFSIALLMQDYSCIKKCLILDETRNPVGTYERRDFKPFCVQRNEFLPSVEWYENEWRAHRIL